MRHMNRIDPAWLCHKLMKLLYMPFPEKKLLPITFRAGLPIRHGGQLSMGSSALRVHAEAVTKNSCHAEWTQGFSDKDS